MSDISAPKRMAMASAVRTLKDWGTKSLNMLKQDRLAIICYSQSLSYMFIYLEVYQIVIILDQK